MKIVINADGVRLRLWFPLSILKSRIAYNVAQNSLENQSRKHVAKQSVSEVALDEQDLQIEVVADTSEQKVQIEQETVDEISLNREQMVEIYNILRRCVKENGHFNLVEVNSHDGEKVIIRV